MKRGGSKKMPPPKSGRQRRASRAIFLSPLCMRIAFAAAPTGKGVGLPCMFFPKMKAMRGKSSAKLSTANRRGERGEICLTLPVAAYILSLLPFLCRGGFHEKRNGGISCALGMECGGGGVCGEGCASSVAPRTVAVGGDVHVPIPSAVSHG